MKKLFTLLLFTQLITGILYAESCRISANYVAPICTDCEFIVDYQSPEPCPALTLTIDSTINNNCVAPCSGTATVTVHGGAAPFTYQWTNQAGDILPDNTEVAQNLCAGVYTVLVTDSLLQTAEISTTIIDFVPTVTHTDITVCSAELPLDLVAHGGGTPADGVYSGDNIANNILEPTAPLHTPFTATYTYTSDGGCTNDTTFTITVRATTRTEIADSICQNSEYHLHGFDITSDRTATPGELIDSLNLTSAFGCDSIIVLNLNIIENPSLPIATEYIECQTPGKESWNTLVDDVTPNTLVWYDSETSTTPIARPADFDKNEVQDTQYWVSQQTAFGCESEKQVVSVTVNEIAQITEATTICDNEEYDFYGRLLTEPGTYVDDTSVQDSITGCPIIITLNLSKTSFVDVSINEDITICAGFEADLYITGYPQGTEILWTGDGILYPTLSQNTVSPTDNETYYVSLKNGRCLFDTLTHVIVNPNPEITGHLEDEPNMGDITLEYINGAAPYTFLLDGGMYTSENGIFEAVRNGWHEVLVEDVNGCTDEYSFRVHKVLIPDIFFTPNGDDQNELWQIENIEAIPSFIYIYDRFGVLLAKFDSEDNWRGWDGIANGHQMPSTDYWYVIQDKLTGEAISGHFTLIR